MTHEEGDRAFYRPATDTVVLPIRKQFMSTAEYFSTAFHELYHGELEPVHTIVSIIIANKIKPAKTMSS